MKKIFVTTSLFLITLSLQASDYDCKQTTTPLTTPRARQKGLTPIPKLMTTIIQLHKEVEGTDFTKQENTFVSSLISKDELLSLLSNAKSTFPKLATNPQTSNYMQQAETIVTSLDDLVKIKKGSVIDVLKLLVAMNSFADSLPKLIHASLEQGGKMPEFWQQLFAAGLPDDEHGRSAKAELLQATSKSPQKTESSSVAIAKQSDCSIL